MVFEDLKTIGDVTQFFKRKGQHAGRFRGWGRLIFVQLLLAHGPPKHRLGAKVDDP